MGQRASVYLYYDKSGELLYVGITSTGALRQDQHAGASSWFSLAVRQDIEHYQTRAEALEREAWLIANRHPAFNRHQNPGHAELRRRYYARTGEEPRVSRIAEAYAARSARAKAASAVQPVVVLDGVFDLAALAAFLKLSERTVDEWDRAGLGPERAKTPGRNKRWLKSTVIAWLKEGRMPPTAPRVEAASG